MLPVSCAFGNVLDTLYNAVYELISTSIGNSDITQVVLTVRGLTVENDPTTDYSKEQEGADR